MAERPPLPVGTIKDEIRKIVKSGEVSHNAVRGKLSKKYPHHELTRGNFIAALQDLVDAREILDVGHRLRATD